MRFKKGMALAAASAMTLTAVCGCSVGKKVSESEYSKTVGATYGKEKIYLDELFIYHRFAQVDMDEQFDQYSSWGLLEEGLTRELFYGMMYSETLTVQQAVKERAVTKLYQTRVLNDYAKENNITLSDEDIKKVEEEVKHYTTGDKAYLFEGTIVNEDLIRRFFTENAIANYAHEKLSEGYDTSVNKEDFRVARGSYFLIPKDKYDDTDEAQRAKDVLAAVQAEYEEKDKKIEDVDFDKIADEFSDKDETVTPTTEAGETAAEGETTAAAEEKHLIKVYGYKDTTIYIGGSPGKLAEAAKDLAVGTFAQTEDDNYIYIVYVSEPTDEDATESRIHSEMHSRKEAKFAERYAELLKDAPKIEVKDSTYDKNFVYQEIAYPTTEAPSTEEPTTEAATEEVTTAETTTVEDTTAEATTEEETTEEAATEEASTEAETGDATSEEVPAEETSAETSAEAEEPTEATTVVEE